MLHELSIFPHDANCSGALIHGDVLYVGTANGVDDDCTPYPQAPSLIALDKRTGRLVGYDDARIGTRVFHGQWSSPSLGRVGGKTLVFFGGGDGICYAFEALERIPAKPRPLECVWSCDCNPSDYRYRKGKPIDYWAGDVRKTDDNKDDGRYVGPSEIIATPVFYKNRVYVTIGQDPEHGRGRGMLTVIDATQTGDISKTGKVWTFGKLDRSLSTVSIADGLLYVADYPGRLFCLDAETGRCLWSHETKQGVWGSTLVADGKVYLGTKKYLCGRSPLAPTSGYAVRSGSVPRFGHPRLPPTVHSMSRPNAIFGQSRTWARSRRSRIRGLRLLRSPVGSPTLHPLSGHYPVSLSILAPARYPPSLCADY
jgi:hypothetical protein